MFCLKTVVAKVFPLLPIYDIQEPSSSGKKVNFMPYYAGITSLTCTKPIVCSLDKSPPSITGYLGSKLLTNSAGIPLSCKINEGQNEFFQHQRPKDDHKYLSDLISLIKYVEAFPISCITCLKIERKIGAKERKER